MIESIFVPAMTGLSAIIVFYITQNSQLREGLTKFVLLKLNKVDVNKIDLKYHKVWGFLRNYKNFLNLSIFSNEVKGRFCQEYIGIVCNEMIKFLEKVSKSYAEISLDKTDLDTQNLNLQEKIYAHFEETQSLIDSEIQKRLTPPEKVRKQFSDWRFAQTNALRQDIEATMTDDVTKDIYYKARETFDKVSSFWNYMNANGLLLFNNINGAFDLLKEEDVIKPITE